MATATSSESPITSLNDPRMKAKLQELRQTDNVTNWWYLFRTWAYLIAVIGGTIAFYNYRAELGLAWWWNIPVTILAIIMVGAGQHQLTGLAHEASHHILFKNRILNDLVSDWCCMFPMFSTTHHYRLQHLAHHQFINDPLRDPDVSQLQTSGHWLDFPVSRDTFLKTVLKQLFIPNLFKFILVRASYNSLPTDKNPYLKKGWKPNKTPIRVGALYLLALVGALTAGVLLESIWLLTLVPLVLYVAVIAFYAMIPDSWYHHTRVHPTISVRHMTYMRITFTTLLLTAIAWLTWTTGQPWWLYFALLWVLPIFTSFSFFMILRQIVQHGNGDRGKLTNTRVFYVNPLINFAVFPMGQEYHLPHHLFASIPHYRLPELHRALMQCEEYRQEAVEVHGYFVPPEKPPKHPTVVDVLGPDWYRKAEDVYIDNSVLEDVEVEEREEIIKEGEAERERRRREMSGETQGTSTE